MTSTTTGTTTPPTDLPKSVRALIALVGVAAAVLSFDTLRALVIVCGTPERIAFLFPVAVDLAAAVATVLWLRARRADVVELARRIAWATLAASVLGNGLEHYLVAEKVAPHWTLVVVVGAVPAAILGAIVHLAVVASSPERAQLAPAAVEDPAPATPAATVVEVAATPGTSDDVLEPSSGEENTEEPLEPPAAGGGQGEDHGRHVAPEPTALELARAFLADNPGAGRRPLSRHLTDELGRDVTPHEAGTLKAAALAGPSLALVREGATA